MIGGLYRKTYLKGKPPFGLKSSIFENTLKKNSTRSKVVCFCYPNRDAEFAQHGYQMENSLLTSEKEIPGVKILLPDVNAQIIENTPGIYGICCKVTKKCFVGESQNRKHRILTRLSDLTQNRVTNSKFFKEFQEYGIQNFELILFQSGQICENFMYRKYIEYKLQSELSAVSLSYNKGITETLQRPGQGFYPSQPGIYCIRCKRNNACYFGQTGQRRGIAGRITKHKSNLRYYQSTNTVMQVDWFRYGEESFEFLAVDYGTEWVDENKRKRRETELIQNHISEGGIVYNTFDNDSGRQGNFPVLFTSFSESTEIERLRNEMHSHPRFPNQFDKAIIANGNTYLSITEAARNLCIHRTAVVYKLRSGTYREATLEEIQLEKARRLSPTLNENPNPYCNIPVYNPVKKRSPGTPMRVSIEGTVYESIADAARSRNVSSTAIRRSIQRGRPNYYLVDSEKNRIDNCG